MTHKINQNKKKSAPYFFCPTQDIIMDTALYFTAFL